MESPKHQKRHVTEYVEIEARGEKVRRAEKVSTERNSMGSHDVWDVETNKDRYWVITDPTNLYSQSDFKSMDYALSFHIGLMTRMSARQHSNASDEDIWKAQKTWRQLEQTHEAFEKADEAEDYQAIGARCRETLITFCCEIAARKIVAQIETEAKKGDVKAQLEAVYTALASGNPMRKIRAHLKSSVSDTWELVGWLTHHKNAVKQDAEYVIEATQQLILNTMMIINRAEKPAPKRCPRCKSYRLIEDFRTELMNTSEHPYIELCETCGWEGEKFKSV